MDIENTHSRDLISATIRHRDKLLYLTCGVFQNYFLKGPPDYAWISLYIGSAFFFFCGDGGGVPSHHRADQHVVLGRAALGLHGHDAHAVASRLGAPRAVQIHQPHALLTWKRHTLMR